MIERRSQAKTQKRKFRPPTVSFAPIRILIADPNRRFRSDLQLALSKEEDMVMVGECDNGMEVISLCGVTKPHVILIDLHLPRMDGVEITYRLSQLAPHTKILILSEQDDPYVLETIRKGASGFMLKDIGIYPMITAMRIIANGGVYIHPILMGRLVEELRRLSHKEQVFQYLYSIHSPISWQEVLTYREMEVLRLISQGKNNRTISEDLYISEKTVKNHVSNILYKMNVQDRTQAVLLAIKYGWIQLI
ncbi:response regulator transcription factor [Hazenella coriacea]|uniref:LuxR family two component transcriptional regulator n=1 Tax=Hazenella coriacea TaxID=1179467 RepID=A0A4R3L7X1_9BACL|nr:response regulator transcription factor [Hazenella coriacea]TCS95642.1 LuxR family two component transcriptional regulator [Hazenella coriacea]